MSDVHICSFFCLKYNLNRKKRKSLILWVVLLKLFKISMMLCDMMSFLLIWGLFSFLFHPIGCSPIAFVYCLVKFCSLRRYFQGSLWDMESVVKSKDWRTLIFKVEMAKRCWDGIFRHQYFVCIFLILRFPIVFPFEIV